MAQRTHHVIAYDVEDDGKRTKLARLLEGYGDRVQKSVFEAELSAAELKEILDAASKLVARDDSLRIYAVCEACCKRVATAGRAISLEAPSARIV
jgi:CRISPR-associated protein Cas2